jgi:Leucine-rich repeat (LRR) protein
MIETDMEFSPVGAQEQPSLESESETIGAKREYTQQQLEKLPEELMTLSAPSIASMTTLSLTRNRFLTLPSALYIFTSLRVLDLSRNKLLGLPAGISTLTQLEELNLLSNNARLSALPLNELTAMSQLRVLDLRCKNLFVLVLMCVQANDAALTTLPL